MNRYATRLMTIGRLSACAVLVLGALLLAACPSPITPTPTPAPSATPSPTGAPGTPMPAGWVAQETDALSVGLPADWRVMDLSAGDLQTVFTEFQKTNPDLAQVIGSADALQGVALWAFRTVPQRAFADNLNIRRSPLEGQAVDDLAAVLEPITAQYQQLGFEVTTSQAGLQIGGRQAAHIAYNFAFTGAGDQPTRLEAHQYLIVGPADIWILSYTAGPGNGAALQPVFEQSAMSFRLK